MLNFKQLEALYWLRELQIFGKAAKRLHVTQPAVSARIASLESQIGQQLFERRHSSIRLTRIGEEIADHAEKIVNAQYALLDNIRRNEKSVLRIGMISPVSFTWGHDLLVRLRDMDTEVAVEFIVASSAHLERELDAGSIDLAFVTRDSRQPPSTSDLVMSYDLGWVGAPELVRDLKQPLSAADLTKQALIMYPQTSPLYSPVHDILIHPKASYGMRHQATSLPAIIEMLRFGYGFSVVSLAVVEKELQTGQLVQIKSEVEFNPLIVHCISQSGHSRRPVKVAIEAARQAAYDYVHAKTRYIRIAPDATVGRDTEMSG